MVCLYSSAEECRQSSDPGARCEENPQAGSADSLDPLQPRKGDDVESREWKRRARTYASFEATPPPGAAPDTAAQLYRAGLLAKARQWGLAHPDAANPYRDALARFDSAQAERARREEAEARPWIWAIVGSVALGCALALAFAWR